MAPTIASFATFLLLGGLPKTVKASEFLKASEYESADRISEMEIRQSFLKEIENSFPSVVAGSPSHRLSQIEATLQPLYAALPKNSFGNLEHPIAHYALQRFFMLRHGWAIKGLDPVNSKLNSSSPAGILKDQVPEDIKDLFEKSLAGNGFNIHDLTVLAATIEHLVREESFDRLRAAFKIHDAEGLGKLEPGEVGDMLDTYMTSYILSENLTDMTSAAAASFRSEIPELFNHWSETQEFVRSIFWKALSEPGEDKQRQQDVATLSRVIVSVEDQFGSFFHDNVCMQMKQKLMRLEYHNSGRVRLSDFYKPALDGMWHFQESVGYLRELGALEETDPQEPSVMIANYLVAPTNCIATSGLYSVCCKNECESLFGHLEEHIAAPEAKSERIAALVESLPSSSTPAPRLLSASLLQRLDEIAGHHEGLVPLHGRLFAQWMHHAYPRECPYPHISGTTSPKLPDQWLEETGTEISASEEEMRQYIGWSRNGTMSDVAVEDLMTWTSEEELLVSRPGAPWDKAQGSAAAKGSWTIFAVIAPFAYALVQTVKATTFSPSAKPEKFEI